MPQRIIVIGSGIAGLAAAYRLQQRDYQVIVFEANPWPGGRMSSQEMGGFIFDRGADFLWSSYREMRALLKELGLTSEWQPIQIEAAAILRDKKIHVFRLRSVRSLIGYSGLSLSSKLKLAKLLGYLFRHRRSLDDHDLTRSVDLDTATVQEFVQTHLSQELLDYYIEPMISGFWYQRADKMSQAVLLSAMSQGPRQKVRCLQSGMGVLPRALAAKLSIHYRSKVLAIRREEGKVRVTVGDCNGKDETVEGAAAVVAVPGSSVLKLLEDPKPYEISFFQDLQYSATIKAAFFLREPVLPHLYGVLCPHKESPIISELSNERVKGEKYTPEGKGLLLIGLHEAAAKDLINVEEEALSSILSAELQKIVPSVTGKIQKVVLQRWPEAIPKFEVGRVRRIKELIEAMRHQKTLFFCGDYLNGPYTEPALTSGFSAARMVHAALGPSLK